MQPSPFNGFILALLILAAGAAYVYSHPSVIGLPLSVAEVEESDALFTGPTSTAPTTNTSSTGGKKSPTSESITGVIECLPHKGDGPHTMECAIGLKSDTGQHYALTNFNYPTDADVGEHVTLVGVTVTTDEFHAKYDIVGTFQVAQTQK